MPSHPSSAHLIRIGYLDTPWNTMLSSNDSSADSSSKPLPRDHKLMERSGQFHGLITVCLPSRSTITQRLACEMEAAVTVPHQSFDNVRLLVGNLHMHGGLVSAGRIELVGLAGECNTRGLPEPWSFPPGRRFRKPDPERNAPCHADSSRLRE